MDLSYVNSAGVVGSALYYKNKCDLLEKRLSRIEAMPMINHENTKKINSMSEDALLIAQALKIIDERVVALEIRAAAPDAITLDTVAPDAISEIDDTDIEELIKAHEEHEKTTTTVVTKIEQSTTVTPLTQTNDLADNAIEELDEDIDDLLAQLSEK